MSDVKSIFGTITQIVFIIAILCFMINALFEGGIPQISWVRTSVILGAAPLAILASGVLMMRVQAERLIKAESNLIRLKTIIFWISFIIPVAIGIGLGRASDLYAIAFQHLYLWPGSVAMIVVGMSLTVLTMRVLRPRSPVYLAMIIVMIFGFFSNSVLGEVTIPLFTDIGIWFQNNPAAAGYQVLWTGSYLAVAAIIARVFAFRERLRGGA